MHSGWETFCLVSFIALMLAPSVFGLHLYVLMFLAHWRRKAVRAAQAETIAQFEASTADADWPLVTTQIPLYNELTVAKRVIEAAARMDYPSGRHEVQVLDDSTDETRRIVDQTCAALRAEGYRVHAVRRSNREHYKAGALAHGLQSARGEFVAIFDADFIPDRGFLRRMIPLIAREPQACCVQGRWGHLNSRESWVTDGLSLGMDGHFGIEQPARAWNGLLLNFNGTGGIWRRSAIDDPRVGGWSGDTITEDLDLSYRAQLVGWKVIYRIDEICPAEVPADVDAMKSQQRRWATGSIQTARKLLPAVWRSRLSIWQKLEATIHLVGYTVSLFMLLMATLGQVLLHNVPRESAAAWLGGTWLIVMLATIAPCIAYAYSSFVLGDGFVRPMRVFRLMMLGMGLAVNNAFAVVLGWLTRGGEFIRTPKTGSGAPANGRSQPAAGSSKRKPAYAAIRSQLYLVELVLGVLCTAQVAWLAVVQGDWLGASFMFMYAAGFLSLGWASRPWARRDTSEGARGAAALTPGLAPVDGTAEPILATAIASAVVTHVVPIGQHLRPHDDSARRRYEREDAPASIAMPLSE